MYTKREAQDPDNDDACVFEILDPQGELICTLDYEDEANALLSHLNR